VARRDEKGPVADTFLDHCGRLAGTHNPHVGLAVRRNQDKQSDIGNACCQLREKSVPTIESKRLFTEKLLLS